MSYFSRAGNISARTLGALVRDHGTVLHSKADLEPMLLQMADKKIVMLGEASHGTHEYYVWRSYISRKLIEDYGFDFIAVEGDWPDCYKINRFIKGDHSFGNTNLDVLKTFSRWPTWMWGNWEIAALVSWLEKHNREAEKQAGFYGLDVYSLWESLEAIIEYLEEEEPEALPKAREAFRCFSPYRADEGTSYAHASRMVPELCEDKVIALLREIRERVEIEGADAEDAFSAHQNAETAVSAEKYYRAMIQGGPHSWNVRDMHMMETLDRLLKFHGPEAKAIVWAHNTHIGDASATDMADEGMYNLGELARKEYGRERVYLAGFGSYAGTVIAGDNWGGELELMPVPEAREGSIEAALHSLDGQNRLLLLREVTEPELLEQRIDHRAIGVVYRPSRERYGNYVPTVLPMRYDAFIYLDQTKALHPLYLQTHDHQMPDTYPFGM